MITRSISLHSAGLSQTNHSHFAWILEKQSFMPCISQKSHPSFNGSLLVSIFNTTNALFRFKALLHIVMHKHELMDHQTLNNKYICTIGFQHK